MGQIQVKLLECEYIMAKTGKSSRRIVYRNSRGQFVSRLTKRGKVRKGIHKSYITPITARERLQEFYKKTGEIEPKRRPEKPSPQTPTHPLPGLDARGIINEGWDIPLSVSKDQFHLEFDKGLIKSLCERAYDRYYPRVCRLRMLIDFDAYDEKNYSWYRRMISTIVVYMDTRGDWRRLVKAIKAINLEKILASYDLLSIEASDEDDMEDDFRPKNFAGILEILVSTGSNVKE